VSGVKNRDIVEYMIIWLKFRMNGIADWLKSTYISLFLKILEVKNLKKEKEFF
jgi:hypothetical protein